MGLAFRTPLDLFAVQIRTERLVLRPIEMSDAAEIFREFTPEITRYMMPRSPERQEETELFLEQAREKLAAGTDLTLAIARRESGELLGCCGLHGREDPARPELGIWLKAGAHGQGLGREAIRGLVEWADTALINEAFIYPVDRANLPSRKIPESLGGRIIAEKLVENMSGGVLDEVIYEIPSRSKAG